MIYFDTLGCQICNFRNQSVLSMLMWIITKNILDYLLGVLSIGKINPIFFLETIKLTIFAIYFDTLGVRDMQFRNQFCIIDVDVNHYKIILYYLLWVLSIAQINSTEVSSYLLIFILFQILYVIT